MYFLPYLFDYQGGTPYVFGTAIICSPSIFFIFYFFDLFHPMLYISNIFAACVCMLVCWLYFLYFYVVLVSFLCCGCVFIFNRRACVRVAFAVVCVCACSMVFCIGCFLGFRIGFMMFYLFALFVRFFS